MDNGKAELVTVVILGIVALAAIIALQVDGKEIAIAISAGLVGYLKGQSPSG